MSEKSRRTGSRKRAAYTERTDQRSDPKPKSRLARKLAKLTPLKTGIKGDIRSPNGAAYKLDAQKPFPFADAPDIARYEAQPFLKWAGGKASLLAQLDEFFPHEINWYIEPFLGGGAVFFHLKHRFPHMRAFLRDSNKELINTYRMVRDRPNELMEFLDEHLKKFRSKGEDYYYIIRKEHDLTDDLARAARTIFLNKTCFNGLYRVNARGEFNTPVGVEQKPITL